MEDLPIGVCLVQQAKCGLVVNPSKALPGVTPPLLELESPVEYPAAIAATYGRKFADNVHPVGESIRVQAFPSQCALHSWTNVLS